MAHVNPRDSVVEGRQPVTQQRAFVPSPSPASARGSGSTVCTWVLTPKLGGRGGGDADSAAWGRGIHVFSAACSMGR